MDDENNNIPNIPGADDQAPVNDVPEPNGIPEERPETPDSNDGEGHNDGGVPAGNEEEDDEDDDNVTGQGAGVNFDDHQ